MSRHVDDSDFLAAGQAKVSQVLLHRRERVLAGRAVDESAEEDSLADVAGTGDEHCAATGFLPCPQVQDEQGQEADEDPNHKSHPVRVLLKQIDFFFLKTFIFSMFL